MHESRKSQSRNPNLHQWKLLAGCICILLTQLHAATAQEGNGLQAILALEKSLIDAIEKAEPAIVSIARIRVNKTVGRPDNFNPLGIDLRQQQIQPDRSDPNTPEFVPDGFGTGVVIGPVGKQASPVILTNYHVVKGGPPVEKPPRDYHLFVRFADRSGYYAEILAADPRSDLAILAINFEQLGKRPQELVTIPIGNGERTRKGQLVVTLGNPYAIGRDGSASASWGMVSNIARRPAPVTTLPNGQPNDDETIHHYGTLLQIDSRLNLGTSGGPVLNLQGEMIGLSTSMAALDGYEKSSGFAIPMDNGTKRVLEELASGYEVEFGFLGVSLSEVTGFRAQQLPRNLRHASAAMAIKIIPDSPASEGGMLTGDVFLNVNGKRVFDHYDVMREVSQLGPGRVANIDVWRRPINRRVQLRVKLGKWPVRNTKEMITTNRRFAPFGGLNVDYPTARYHFLPFPLRYQKAVVVTNVAENSSAARTDLRAGDFIARVDEFPVETPQEFADAVRGKAKVTLHLADARKIELKR